MLLDVHKQGLQKPIPLSGQQRGGEETGLTIDDMTTTMTDMAIHHSLGTKLLKIASYTLHTEDITGTIQLEFAD